MRDQNRAEALRRLVLEMGTMGRDLLDEIPTLARWRIATRAASLLPALYARALRDERGTPEEREQMVWYTLGREVKTIVDTSGLPTRTAGEICEGFKVGTVLISGPEFRISVIETSEESATLIMKGCPHLRSLWEAGVGEEVGLSWCLPFALAAVEAMNPAYTMRFVRARCMGDNHCEMVVQKKEEE